MDSLVLHVVIIGGGPPGENVADRAVKRVLTACIVEQRLLGGSAHTSRAPSKALLRPVEAVSAPVSSRASPPTSETGPVFANRDYWNNSLDDSRTGEVGGGIASPSCGAAGGSPASAGSRSAARCRGPARGRARHRHDPSHPERSRARGREPWTNRKATTSFTVSTRRIVLGGGVVTCPSSPRRTPGSDRGSPWSSGNACWHGTRSLRRSTSRTVCVRLASMYGSASAPSR